MAEFIAKLGLDAKDFISSMETAAAKAASITTALNSSAGSSKTLADGFKSANTEATNLDKNVKSIEGNLSKAASGGGALDGLTAKFKEGQTAASQGGGIFGDLAGKLGNLASPAGAATAAVAALGGALTAAYTVGSEFQQNLAGVSAVTGLTGPALDDIGDRARNLAKQFGGDASTQLQAFQGVLSKFGASLADTPEQLGKVSENINILAKAGGLDAKEAMDTLANSMLQFGVDVADGNVAAAESARYMNVLAASAKVGAAEIPQVGQAVLVAGVAAKGAKVSFEETNAAIQVLAAGGKVGAEAGTALRNVLGKIAGEEVLPKEAADKLKSLGVDMSIVSNRSLSLSDRLKELQKASSDATAFAQVFGSENAAAATILADGAGTIKDWTAQITGTSEANKQAATNMDTLSERVSRAKASISDFAIGLFQTLEPAFSAIIGGIMDFVGVVTDGIGGLWSFVEPLVMPIFEFFNLRLVVAFNVIKSVITGFVEAGREAFARFQEIIAPLQEKLQGLFSSADEGSSIMDTLKGVFQTIAAVAKDVFSIAFGIALKVIEGVVAVVTQLVDYLQQGIKWVKEIAQAVKDWGTELIKSNQFIQGIVGNVIEFINQVSKLKDQLLSILGLGGKTQEVKIQAKVETNAEETKTAVETEAAKNPPEVKVKVKKADSKDISEQLRAQQAEIDRINREVQESAIEDENLRAIRNIENQFADKIAKVRDQNKKVQDDEKVTAAQKAQAQALSDQQIIALITARDAQIDALREKQREKEVDAARKAYEAFEAQAKKRSDESRKKERDDEERDNKDKEEKAKQAATKAEEAKLRIVRAFTDAVAKVREDANDNALKAAQNLAALDAEEKALTESLNRRELSYEDFNIAIADIERRRAALQADVQSGANSTFKNEMDALVTGIRASIGQSLTNMKEDFDFEFSEASKKGELNLQALGASAATLFGSLVANGSSAVDALKQSLSQTLGSLIEVYVAPIIASTLSFLGPFALPVALAAVQGLKSLLNSALAGFQDGGYTGNAGEGAVAGVVHGQEFVHTASVTRKNRALFEYLHKGGELSNWAVSAAGNLQQPVSIAAPMMNTYGIESRLDRLETAIVKSSKRFDSMRAVQMTVEHDPTLTIKAQSRNLQVRNARV
jgi:TP901 family phage tail tape measure protein